MARRRFGSSFRRRTTSKSRLLEWGGLQTGQQTIAANVPLEVTLLAAADFGFKITHFRSVGVLSAWSQASLGAGTSLKFSMGIYRAVRGSAGIPTVLSPQVDADINADQWLWWSTRTIAANLAAGNESQGADAAMFIPFDVKVKRILDVGDEIVLVLVGDLAWRGSASVRTLLRPAGI